MGVIIGVLDGGVCVQKAVIEVMTLYYMLGYIPVREFRTSHKSDVAHGMLQTPRTSFSVQRSTEFNAVMEESDSSSAALS